MSTRPNRVGYAPPKRRVEAQKREVERTLLKPLTSIDRTVPGFEDFALEGYDPLPHIKAAVAV